MVDNTGNIEIGDRAKIIIKGFDCSFYATVTRVGSDHISMKKDGKLSTLSGDIDRQHIVEVIKKYY